MARRSIACPRRRRCSGPARARRPWPPSLAACHICRRCRPSSRRHSADMRGASWCRAGPGRSRGASAFEHSPRRRPGRPAAGQQRRKRRCEQCWLLRRWRRFRRGPSERLAHSACCAWEERRRRRAQSAEAQLAHVSCPTAMPPRVLPSQQLHVAILMSDAQSGTHAPVQSVAVRDRERGEAPTDA